MPLDVSRRTYSVVLLHKRLNCVTRHEKEGWGTLSPGPLQMDIGLCQNSNNAGCYSFLLSTVHHNPQLRLRCTQASRRMNIHQA